MRFERGSVGVSFLTSHKSRRPKKAREKASLFFASFFTLTLLSNHAMAVEILVAIAAVLAAALAVRWARHHGPLRPRGAPPSSRGRRSSAGCSSSQR